MYSHKRQERIEQMARYKVRGNKELGWSIAIPTEAFAQADQPEEYDFCACENGTLVYTPVKS